MDHRTVVIQRAPRVVEITGEQVALGSPLGVLEVGHPRCPVAACLHWGLRRGTVYLDPLLLLTPLRVRLKPL